MAAHPILVLLAAAAQPNAVAVPAAAPPPAAGELVAADPAAPVPSPTPPVVTLPAPATPAAPSGSGDIVVSGRARSPADPMVQLNAKSFEAVQAVDHAVVAPMATGYRKSVPSPIRSGLRNFLRNLEEPVSAVNFLLQLKPGRAARSVVRFAFNSTVGVAGLVDVAKRKPLNIPYYPNGFANTFACYGIGPGPYFFLPLLGPITLRDLVGLALDKPAFTLALGRPFNRPAYSIPAITIDALNDRIEQDAVLTRMREESPDPYVATRELYLRQRRAEIAGICPRKGDAPTDPTLPPRVGKGAD